MEEERPKVFYEKKKKKKARTQFIRGENSLTMSTTCRPVTLFPHEILTHSPFTMDPNYTRRLLIRSCNARASRPQMSDELLISVVTISRSIRQSYYERFHA